MTGELHGEVRAMRQIEERAPSVSQRNWDRKVDTIIVVLLAVASLLAAWGGYQAGLWSGDKSTLVTTAEAKQVDATRATTIGYQFMQIDVATFFNWLNAYKSGNTVLATFYSDRFTPQLRPAFDAWWAADPMTNAEAPADPFGMPEYQVPQLLEAAQLDAESHQAFATAEHYGATSDAFVLSTLLLAVVLFFGGVCTKIGWRPAQLALLGLAIVLLFYSVYRLGSLPDRSTWAITPLWGE